jgi:hypothetical protein
MSKVIACDFDGTLVEHDAKNWKGVDACGAPIPAMVDRVKRALAAGHTVIIFTARADPRRREHARAVKFLKAWCLEHLGRELGITAIKSPNISEIWDDRCVSVLSNKGAVRGTEGTLWATLGE